MTTYDHPNPAVAEFEPGIVAGISALLIVLVLAIAFLSRDTSLSVSTPTAGPATAASTDGHDGPPFGGRLVAHARG